MGELKKLRDEKNINQAETGSQADTAEVVPYPDRSQDMQITKRGSNNNMTFKDKLKQTLVDELNLEDVQPEDIQDDAPLFGEGLGLDSLDAVELVVIVQRHFGVEIANMEQGQAAFQSIDTLSAFIQERKP